MTRDDLLSALRDNGGNRKKAAASLDIGLRTLHRRMAELLTNEDLDAMQSDLKDAGGLDAATARGIGMGHKPSRARLLEVLKDVDGDREKAAGKIGVGIRWTARWCRSVLLQKDRDLLREHLEKTRKRVPQWLKIKTEDRDDEAG